MDEVIGGDHVHSLPGEHLVSLEGSALPVIGALRGS